MPETFSLATWNINSVRLRMPIVTEFLKKYAPDVLCLQETKCPDANFPSGDLAKLGYEHIALKGQKSYHGVATISRHPLQAIEKRQFCGKEDARHVEARIDLGGKTIRVHNFYVPAGGDEPDRDVNEKFGHKLDFLDEMKGWLTGSEVDHPSILVGDLNIAPFENDVWSHKQLLKVVSHTPIEVEKLEAVRQAGDWIDTMREFVPHDEKLYTWWSYRAKDWSKADKGRRLDHIWVTPHLKDNIRDVMALRDVRGWEKPSDHAPVLAKIEI